MGFLLKPLRFMWKSSQSVCFRYVVDAAVYIIDAAIYIVDATVFVVDICGSYALYQYLTNNFSGAELKALKYLPQNADV